MAAFASALSTLYGDYAILDDGFADFHVAVDHGAGLRRYFGARQTRFLFDGKAPFKPLPAAQAYPGFEWGLNWCVANHCHQYLMIHSAVVERGGRAAILAAPPGSGKSTLCAGLIHRGWRLFSDELALIDTTTGELIAFPRPVCLKNESVQVIRRFAPEARFGPLVSDTRKGTVCHLRPSRRDIEFAAQPARPAWLVFPRFQPGVETRLRALPRAKAGLSLARNAFNFSVLGETAFARLTQVVDGCEAYELDYGDLEAAATLFDRLSGST